MVSVAALWLPILLSAVLVFVASSIMHVLLPYHRSDYQKLPEEDKLLASLRAIGLKRGLYIFPFGTHKEMKSPVLAEKYKQGPVGVLTVMPSGLPVMPKLMGMWFVYCLIIGYFAADLTARTLAPGAHFSFVFRMAGTAAFLGYGVGRLSDSIWKGQTWSATLKDVIDGLVYGLLTGATFGWLWPR
jgi:hypothetical protein